jgi:RNA polymerase sigma factor (sigma-70 family)
MTSESELVEQARSGDRKALEALVKLSKDLVYNLAVRMLGNPADAEDVSQAILIRVVTGLASFRGDSAFRTWVYKIASNHLLTARTQRAGSKEQTFEGLEEILAPAIEADLPALEDQVLVTQARVTCTTAMLMSLDRDHRLAYVLGEVLELSSDEGATVLDIAPEAFRKRLSRARDRMAEFTQRGCGLVNEKAPCRCAKQAACFAKAGYLKRETAAWANHPVRQPQLKAQPLEGHGELERVAAVFRSHPEYAAPDSLVAGLKAVLAR